MEFSKEMQHLKSQVNKSIRKTASGNKKIHLLDIEEQFPLSSKNLWDDGIHLSHEGYDKLGVFVANAIYNDCILN